MCGVKKEDISVYFDSENINGNNEEYLVISGKKQLLEEDKDYFYTECSGITLDKDYELKLKLSKHNTYIKDKKEASFDNGLLVVKIFRDVTKTEKDLFDIK